VTGDSEPHVHDWYAQRCERCCGTGYLGFTPRRHTIGDCGRCEGRGSLCTCQPNPPVTHLTQDDVF
jgi:hypothetical protein